MELLWLFDFRSKEKKATAQHQTNNTIFIEGVEKAEGENVS